MIIKANKEYKIISFFLFIISFIVSMLFYSIDNNFFISLIVLICLLFVSLRFYITFCKTIIIDERGISISLLLYRKVYCWSDLKTKRVIDLSGSYGYKDTATRGVEFSPCRIDRHSLLKSASYSFFFRPLKIIFIYFNPKSILKYTTNYSLPYAIDEDEFFKKINEYGVDLDEQLS